VGHPDPEAGRMVWEIEVPGLLSWLVHGNTEATVLGLDAVPREYWPNVTLSYWSYHAMIILGMSFVGLTVLASFFRIRGTLFEKRWLLWIFVFAVGGAMAANQLGWAAAEVGRQPWVVHPRVIVDDAGDPVLTEAGQIQYRMEEGLLTSDGVSKAVSAEHILASIIMFGVIYLLLGAVWVFVLNQKIQTGPTSVPVPEKHRGFLAAATGLTDHTESLTGRRSGHAPPPHGSEPTARGSARDEEGA
jgi:cytochrome d ubiquinol oxidase subunit I